MKLKTKTATSKRHKADNLLRFFSFSSQSCRFQDQMLEDTQTDREHYSHRHCKGQ